MPGRLLATKRLMTLRRGFSKKVWGERDHGVIFNIAKIPENVLQEEPELLMWYEQALAGRKED